MFSMKKSLTITLLLFSLNSCIAMDDRAVKRGILDLSHQNISNLTDYLQQIPDKENIRELKLAHNQITTVKVGDFEGFSNLQQLDLSHNELAEIEPGAFESTSNLQLLDLKYNELTTIKSGTLAGLHQLDQFCLAHNPVTEIEPDLFNDAKRLTKFCLDSNPCVLIKHGSLNGINSLEDLKQRFNKRLEEIHEIIRKEKANPWHETQV